MTNNKINIYVFYALVLLGIAVYGFSHDHLLVPVKHRSPVPLDGLDAYIVSLAALIGALVAASKAKIVMEASETGIKPSQRRFYAAAAAYSLFFLGLQHHLWGGSAHSASTVAQCVRWGVIAGCAVAVGGATAWLTERKYKVMQLRQEGKPTTLDYRQKALIGRLLGALSLCAGLFLAWVFGSADLGPLFVFCCAWSLSFLLGGAGGRTIGRYIRTELTNPSANLQPMWASQRKGLILGLSAVVLFGYLGSHTKPPSPPALDPSLTQDLAEGRQSPTWPWGIDEFKGGEEESAVFHRLAALNFNPDCYDSRETLVGSSTIQVRRLCEVHVNRAFGGTPQYAVFAFSAKGLVNYRIIYPGDQWQPFFKNATSPFHWELPEFGPKEDKYGMPAYRAATGVGVWSVAQPASTQTIFMLSWQSRS